MEKLLTIIMPTFKREQLIAQRFKELNNLDIKIKKEFEIIVINDGGGDINIKGTEINIKIINNKKNMGRGPSILKGIEMADSRYISMFDDDDKINIKNLEHIIERMKNEDDSSKGYICRTSASKTSEYKNGQFVSYRKFRHNKPKPGDHKEFAPLKAVRKVINPFYYSRRLPTSLIYFEVDNYINWEYQNYEIVDKVYHEGGMTRKLKSNPIKKYVSVAYIYYTLKYLAYLMKRN